MGSTTPDRAEPTLMANPQFYYFFNYYLIIYFFPLAFEGGSATPKCLGGSFGHSHEQNGVAGHPQYFFLQFFLLIEKIKAFLYYFFHSTWH
jgi:hypothetical protein